MENWTKVEMTDYDAYESPCGKYRIRPYHKRIDDFSEETWWRPGVCIGNGSFSYLDTDFLYSSKEVICRLLTDGYFNNEFMLNSYRNLSKKTKHDGDCTIYRSLINNRPFDGICTCGYGWQQVQETGSEDHLLSQERKDKIPSLSPEQEAQYKKAMNELFGEGYV